MMQFPFDGPPDTRNEITWLEVPFKERNEAKSLGARWNAQRVQWYAPANTDLTHLRPWLKTRIYLQCPSDNHDDALQRGAKWDRIRREMYITNDMDTVPFTQWLLRDQ